MSDWNGIRRIFGIYEEICYGELILFNIAFCKFRFVRIFLYDGQVVDLTYEILMATDWEQAAPPHRLVRMSREMSKISRLLRLWATSTSRKVIEIVKDKLRHVVLQIETYIRNRIYQLIGNIQSARSRVEDAESQLEDCKSPESAGRSDTDDPQALIEQAEIAFNTLLERAEQDVFKGSVRFADALADYFRRWKAMEYV